VGVADDAVGGPADPRADVEGEAESSAHIMGYRRRDDLRLAFGNAAPFFSQRRDICHLSSGSIQNGIGKSLDEARRPPE
jgi:hypothetical protein